MGLWSSIKGAVGFERKSAVSAPIAGTLPAQYGSLLSAQEITPYNAWLSYMNVSALSKVVNLVADETARLVPLVRVDGKPVSDHPITKFMARPGFQRNRQKLIKQLAVQYLVTGNAYPHIIGEPSRPPLAIDVLKSALVNHTPGHDMWPDQFYYSEGTRSIRFHRDPAQARDFRWIDESGLGEVVPIYDVDGYRRGVGISRLNSIRHDVDMRLKGIVHNSSVLDKGARMSGVLSVKDGLSEDQREELKQQIRTSIGGASNAGGILVTGGGEMEFTQMSMNAKDMDFANLIRIVEDAIATCFNVPVTLYRTDAQTSNNYEVAWRQLYFTSVLPVFETVWGGLGAMFSERLQEDVEIVHDALTNPILAMHSTTRATQLFGAHMISRNEARDMVGFEPALGGDTIYGPMGEVPVGEDFFTGVEPGEGLTADAYHDQRPGSLPPERQPVAKPADEGKPEKKPKAKAPKKKEPATAKDVEKALTTLAAFQTKLNTPALRVVN